MHSFLHYAKLFSFFIGLFFALPSMAQLIFCKNDNMVEYNVHDTVIVLPCCVNNIEATNINELYVKWKFKDKGSKDILTFDGAVKKYTRHPAFKTAKIDTAKLIKGNASLTLHQSNAVPGQYTCEVTELSREGETCITLKFRDNKAGSPRKKIPNPYICPCEKDPKDRDCETCKTQGDCCTPTTTQKE